MNRLFLRAAAAVLVLPGLVAGLVPWLLLPQGARVANVWGLVPAAAGIGLLMVCVREFYTAGRGTLAPWSPPLHLVTTGPYRWSRNPMYVAVSLVLWGWALGFASGTHAAFAVAMMVAFHLRVVLGEEPWLARTHGDAWADYSVRVPRYFAPRR